MWLKLDGEGPLYRQLYRALRVAILAGDPPPGARLPPTRELGREDIRQGVAGLAKALSGIVG